MKNRLPVILLLAIFFILAITSVATKSPTCDEAAHHIGAGYSYIKTHDFRITPSPPLIRLLMGLPLVFLNPRLPLDHISWKNADSAAFNYQFLFVYNNDADKIVFFSRIPMIILATALGLLVFLWARRLYGYRAGIFALFLYSFSPVILGNAGLSMLDMGCAAFIFAAVMQFYRYLEKQDTPHLILSGMLFGLAQATKITALVLYPMFIIFILAYWLANKGKKALSLMALFRNVFIIWAIGLVVLWATYFFEFKPLLKNEPDVGEKIEYIKKFAASLPAIENKEKVAEKLLWFANNVPIPLSTYAISILGFGRQIVFGDQGLFFMGNYLKTGSRLYYAVLYLIRTPVPFIIFVLLAIVLYKRVRKTGFLEDLFLLTPVIGIFLAASFSKLQGGIRYILPFYPFLFVWVSRIAAIEISKKTHIMKVVFYGLCIWYIFSSVLIYPHFLAYFNELAGGPGGHAYKITTDADWGQDFKELSKYLDKHGIKSVKLLCFGAVDPAYYGIRYKNAAAEEYKTPVPGEYYAISARYLPSVKWADNYKPVDRITYTIFIYHIKDEFKK